MFGSVWRLMESRDKWRFVILVFGILLTSVWNIGGIASIMPFIELLANPDAASTNRAIVFITSYLNIEITDQTVVWVGAVVLMFFVTGNALLALVTWSSINFSRTVAYGLSRRMFRTYIWQDYAFYLTHNTSELMKNMFSELNNIIGGVLKPLVELLVEGALAIGVIAFLVVIDPIIALFAALLLGGGYGIIFLLFRSVLNRGSRAKVRRNREKYITVADAFGAIKELKIMGVEDRYTRIYDRAAFRLERAKARIQGISKLPRYVLETLAFGGILGLALFLFSSGQRTQSLLPLMSAYVFAGYKLLPSLQRMFSAFARIRGSHASVDLVVRELGLPVPDVDDTGPDIPFQKAISLDNITFYYENTSRPALDGVSFQIERNTTVGIAGPTGCGKTTLVDVILGLHTHQSGALRVDDVEITPHNVRSWRRHFGYVPQFIYLSDTSITRNIAFGHDEKDIDHERVVFCARLANLHDFVTTLDEGYDTQLGERGVRLSGGQRQRVGIARALYDDPDILIFDEATSALDTNTEQAVMDAITNLMHKKTIIIIAHRLSTLKDADRVVVLKDGRVDTIGTYDSLKGTHDHFSSDS